MKKAPPIGLEPTTLSLAGNKPITNRVLYPTELRGRRNLFIYTASLFALYGSARLSIQVLKSL